MSQGKITVTVVLIAIVIVLLFSSIPLKNTLAGRSVTLSPTTAHRTFWLLGSIMGWNQTRPGPLVSVTDGDLVTIMYNSIDSAPHTWFIDVNNNNMPDPGEISSPTIASSATPFVNFTFTLKVGTNIPSTGDFTYRCSYHPTMMFGTFRVQASTAPDFTITANPTAIGPINTKAPGTSTITVTPTNGFNGAVTLTTSPSSGLNASVFPTTVPSGSGTASLSVNSTTAGSYSVTIIGTGSSGTHPAMVTVTVVMPDFKIALSYSTLTVAQGSSGSVMVTLTSLDGFSGTVSLTSTLSSLGPQVAFNPSTVPVSSTGPATSTLSVSAASSGAYSTPVSQGNYNVNVTGTSGSLVHSATLALTVGSSSGAGALPSVAVIGGGIAAAIAVVAGIVYVLRRRPKTKA